MKATMSNSTSQPDTFRCYLFNDAIPELWGDCCEDLSIVPKPIWVVFLLSVPIEAVLAGSDVRATAGMYEEKSNQTAVIFLLYNFVTLGLLAYQFDWGSCEANVEGVWECYQGLLFMFYNSTAALASMTLWMLIIMRKYYPQLYFVTRLVISPRFLWRWFDRLNLKNGGTHATVERWNMISTSTKLFWYNKVGIITTLLFGGTTHIIPMFLAYPYILVNMCIALVYSHSLRLGYTGLKNRSNLWSAIWNVSAFYPFSLAISTFFLSLSPISIVLKCCGFHSMDRTDKSLPTINSNHNGEIEIFFKTKRGGLITLEFNVQDTVNAVIPKVQDNLGFDFIKSTIHLEFNGEKLDESETVTLGQYGITSGDSLDIVVENGKVEIRVRLEDGSLILLKMNPGSTVSELMKELEEMTGIPKKNQYLLQQGKRAANNMKVSRLDRNTELELFPLNILVRITLPDKTVVRATVGRDASYEDLRSDIARLERTREAFVRLYFNDLELQNGQTLHSQGLRMDSELRCVMEIELIIRVEDGRTAVAQFNTDETVESLMLELEMLTGIPIASQFLALEGKQLRQHTKLANLDGYELDLFSDEFRVTVELSNGRKMEVQLRRSARSLDVHERIARLENTTKDYVEIYLNRSMLKCSRSKRVHDLGLRNGSTLRCRRVVHVTVEVETTVRGSGRSFKVVMNTQATVKSLKNVLEITRGTPFPQYLLVFANEEVLDNTAKMIEFSPTSFSVVLCHAMLTISVVNRYSGETVKLRIKPTATFGEFRKRVAWLLVLSIDEIHLVFPRLQEGEIGQVIRDTLTLREIGVRAREVVEVVPKELQEEDDILGRRRRQCNLRYIKSRARALQQRLLYGTGSTLPPPPRRQSRRFVAEVRRWGGGHQVRAFNARKRRSKGVERTRVTDKEVVVQTRQHQAQPSPGLDKSKQEMKDTDIERSQRKKERRRRVLAYIKDILRNLCMFDPNGKVIMFAAATTFLCFTFSANYALLLYSGAPYLDVLVLDWNARSSSLWFQCTAANFIDINAFGLIDFLGLAIGTAAALIEFVDFLVSI